MISNAVARRYAHALFQLAQENETIDLVEKDMKTVAKTVLENEQLAQILSHRLIPVEDKKNITEKIFSQAISTATLNFLMLTVDKQRETYWPEMAEEFAKMAAQARNLSTAQVTAAVAMSREDILDLEKKLSKVTGRNIKAEVTIDSTIMGGLVVQIGDQVMDGSVKKRLELLQHNLKKINFTVSGVN